LFGGAGSGVLALVDHGSAASFALGAVLSEVSLWALERQVRWIMQSERRRSRRYLPALLLVGKYVVIGAVLYAVGRADWIRLGYLGMGVCALLIAVLACLALYVASGRAFAEEHGST
jgi:H+/gluconate symporter-like permease